MAFPVFCRCKMVNTCHKLDLKKSKKVQCTRVLNSKFKKYAYTIPLRVPIPELANIPTQVKNPKSRLNCENLLADLVHSCSIALVFESPYF